MSEETFADALENRILLFDGAMGTEIQRYDPKSDRWLRVSFFAGAPFYENLSSNNVDSWGFATMNSYN